MRGHYQTRWTHALAGLTLSIAIALGACTDEGRAPGGGGANVAISVAPFDLQGTSNARYEISVTNGDGELVWTRILTANQFGGSGGSLSYVGPCDASSPLNTVTLEVLDLYAGPTGDEVIDPTSYNNPGPLARQVQCVENKDTSVEFDITILIDPPDQSLGNVIIALGFHDLFCSAKVDCVDELLLDPNGDRNTTAVVALACTAGVGADTVLYQNNITVDCGANGQVIVDPSAGPGSLATGQGISGDGGILYGAQVQQGAEHLGYNKLYWNTLLGLEDGVADCVLTARATATDGPLVNQTMPAGVTYPYIDFNVTLTDVNGTLVCDKHPLNGTGDQAGVSAGYTDGTAATVWSYIYLGPTVGITGALTAASPGHWEDGAYAASCDHYRHPTDNYVYSGSTGDGVYRIDPTGGDPADAFDVYCDMTSDGGGWTLVSQSAPTTDETLTLCTTAAVTGLDLDATTISAPAKLSDAAINGVWQTGTRRELLIKAEVDAGGPTANYANECIVDFKASRTWTSATGGTQYALSDLESTSLNCLAGSVADGVIDNLWVNSAACGFSYQLANGGGNSDGYVIYSTSPSYSVSGGSCAQANDAGRGWLSYPNWGCNAVKTFVR